MKKAFTLTEIMIVVAIIGLLASVGIPTFVNSIARSREKTKEINMASVEAAKEQWALIENKSEGDTVTWDDIQDFMGSGVSEESDLNVGECSITLNPIGTEASYPSE